MRGPRSFPERKGSGTRKSRGAIAKGRAAGTRSPSEGQAASEPRAFPAPSPFLGKLLRQEHAAQGRQGARDPRPTQPQPCPATESVLEADPRAGRAGPESGSFRSGRRPARPSGSRRRWRQRLRPSRRGREGVLVRMSVLHHRPDPLTRLRWRFQRLRPHRGAKRAGGRVGWLASTERSEAQNGRSTTPGRYQTRRRTEGVYTYRPLPPNVICRTPLPPLNAPGETGLAHPRARPLIGRACGPCRLPYSG